MPRLAKSFAVVLFATTIYVAPAHAQATRTWVSGVGDDANPCSRTAPCKTFAGAISKTAAGGEINCLDPAGFGAVTINKSLVISCPYTEGGVLAAGNGIVVNAGPSDIVVLRGLDIFGVNPPANGVRFIAGGALHIEDSTIRRFNAANSFGISFQPSGASVLTLDNVTVTSNGNGATGGGILIQPTGGSGSARALLTNVHVNGNANDGIRVDSTGNTAAAGILVTIDGSTMSNNTNGLIVFTPASTANARVMLTNSTVSGNSGVGVLATGGTASARVGNTTITFNGTGVAIGAPALVQTYGNNRLNGNTNDGVFSSPAIAPQ
jgi:hypothetical protein